MNISIMVMCVKMDVVHSWISQITVNENNQSGTMATFI